MTNEEFIEANRESDVRVLALKKFPEGIDAAWCLQQIEGWQTARRKLPLWADNSIHIWYPPRISMEQCSSQQTAEYKSATALRLLGGRGECKKLIDLTGGYGVDFSYMAPHFLHAIYVEKQAVLCEIARHNFPLLGLRNAEIVNADDFCSEASLIFLDPARRDSAGRKVVALEECSPNVVEKQEKLLSQARFILIKLSPMLDVTEALRKLRNVTEVHVVSLRGECKELLFVMDGSVSPEIGNNVRYYCVNIAEDTTVYTSMKTHESPETADSIGKYLYEPNASILKVGVQDTLCANYGILKLHPRSNLYTSDSIIEDFPGRRFSVEAVSDFAKKSLKNLLTGIGKANLTVRNFPATVDELRSKLKLKEGGDCYLFATTVGNGRHILIKCRK